MKGYFTKKCSFLWFLKIMEHLATPGLQCGGGGLARAAPLNLVT